MVYTGSPSIGEQVVGAGNKQILGVGGLPPASLSGTSSFQSARNPASKRDVANNIKTCLTLTVYMHAPCVCTHKFIYITHTHTSTYAKIILILKVSQNLLWDFCPWLITSDTYKTVFKRVLKDAKWQAEMRKLKLALFYVVFTFPLIPLGSLADYCQWSI